LGDDDIDLTDEEIRIAVGAEQAEYVDDPPTSLRTRAIGIVVGLLLALGSLRFAASLLYGVSPSDSATVVGVMIFVTVVGLSAGLVPACNAARTDPCNALRQD
jgi:putative ABC transport system permease protein